MLLLTTSTCTKYSIHDASETSVSFQKKLSKLIDRYNNEFKKN